MKKRGAVEKPKRPTKLEHLAMTTELDWRHQNSVVVQSRIRVLQFEADEMDKSIVALAAALASAKERRAKVDAMIAGLTSVVARR